MVVELNTLLIVVAGQTSDSCTYKGCGVVLILLTKKPTFCLKKKKLSITDMLRKKKKWNHEMFT